MQLLNTPRLHNLTVRSAGCYRLAEQEDGLRPRANSWQAQGFELESQVTFPQNAPARPISLFEKREELRRVLESKNFARAPRKTRFLEFVSEQTFLGNSDNLNEYLIGVEVYGRGASFNAQEDPIVRVQAHDIRRLLKQYY